MKRPLLIAAVWGLVLYLALFSSVALLHAYAQDELTDAHGCAIGAWVQHATATEASAPLLAALVCLNQLLFPAHDVDPYDTALDHASRGPPFLLS